MNGSCLHFREDPGMAATFDAAAAALQDAIDAMTTPDEMIAEIESLLNDVISADHPNGCRPSHGQVLSDPYLMRGLGLAGPAGLIYQNAGAG